MTEDKSKELDLEKLEQDIEQANDEFKKENEKIEKELEETREGINKEIASYYGKDSINLNNTISVDAKVDRYQEKLDFINGDLSFDNEDDIPERLRPLKNMEIKDTKQIENIIQQIKDSKEAKHLVENITISKLPVNENKLKKVNEKLNMKIYRYNKLRGNENNEYNYIDLEEIYYNLKNALDNDSFKESNILYKFMCSLGSYMSQNYEKYPYYIKSLSENVDYIGKFGNKLDQNEDFIKVINSILKKY
ncbi:hypothetical protein CPT_MarsHill_073 [Staphylococcus phage MarsHill]|nr:hypothetical protein CPT_MarsHill_073 [Staphylococcus phage MarsHill]QQO92728.1 hypothetical protein CPT_Madawaska_073 [Staphylococcus phage Madawaska]